MFEKASKMTLYFLKSLYQAWCWDLSSCLILGGVLIGLVGLGVSGIGWWQVSHQSQLCPIASGSNGTPQSSLFIDLSGAIMKPGVYQLPTGARLAAALDMAGGFGPEVDLQLVAQKINLAEPIEDGQKVFIPFKTPAISATMQGSSVAVENKKTEMTPSLISINTATTAEIDSLPGIGAKRAAEIIAGRPYSSLEELMTKEVLTEGVFADIKDLIQL